MLSDDRKVVNHTDLPCDAEEIKSASDSTMTINEFLFALNIDNINLVKLLQYMKESNIIYKVISKCFSYSLLNIRFIAPFFVFVKIES